MNDELLRRRILDREERERARALREGDIPVHVRTLEEFMSIRCLGPCDLCDLLSGTYGGPSLEGREFPDCVVARRRAP